MSAAVATAGMAYPERHDAPPGRFERVITAFRYLSAKVEKDGRHLRRIVAATNEKAAGLDLLSDAELRTRAAALRPRLRRGELSDPALTGEAFALVREAAVRAVQMRHFDVQLVGAWAMLNGMLAEMETGEGKSLTATLAAATAALAGRTVHVITVNDYLAERDAQIMKPVYERLGLTVGCVRKGMDAESRRQAYSCDLAYCSNKEIAFDYLRDRMVLGGKPRAIAMKFDVLDGKSASGKLLLRGLQFAIVDEADSVLIDEARTPLILSGETSQGEEEAISTNTLDD